MPGCTPATAPAGWCGFSFLREKLLNPQARSKQRARVQHTVDEILKGERGPELIRVAITERDPGRFDLTWELDRTACLRVVEEVSGKKILITSQEAWDEADIIAASCGQSHIERVFKHLTCPHHHAVQPQYHWTDQKIAVHTFICITGLLLSQILWNKARELGYAGTLESLLDRLSEIRKAEIVSVTGMLGKPVKGSQLEEMDPEINTLYHQLLEAF